MARPRHGQPCTIVIKLGTSSIVHEVTHQPLLSTLSAVVETVVHLRSQGHKVVLVSSGAIGVGLKRMDMANKPRSLEGKQALAAIGQGRLIALWDNLFGQLEQPIAQVLLTRGDISDRTRYLNAINTFKELLSMGVVPIVNENDTVSVSEIKFGDNDTLSAITSSMIHADYLFLLTDVDGLYTSNPRKDPTAKAIDVVSSVSAIRAQVSTKTLGSNLGTGGMETKLIAAEIATAAGVTTVITSSKHPKNILSIMEYYASLKYTSNPSSGTTTPLAPSKDTHTDLDTVASSLATPIRPPHTVFTPSATPLRDLKSWTSHTLSPSGSVIIDSGAHQVLSRRESGGRLLPAGVLGVKGAFASGQAVRIVVRKLAEKEKGSEQIVVDQVGEELTKYENGNMGINEEVGPGTQPNTPNITAVSSASSSITTIFLPASLTMMSFDETSHKALPTVPEQDMVQSSIPASPSDGTENWDVVEVGRGLANYNSEQILRVKGLNSSFIPHLLGYADSEYVVENITIRIPASRAS